MWKSVFLHWDQTLDVSTTHGASILILDKIFAAVPTNAEVTTGHDDCVFFSIKADQTLFRLRILHVDFYLALFSFVLFSHAIDGLDLEGHSINQNNLLEDSHSGDRVFWIQSETAVINHREGLVALLIVDWQDQGVVAPSWFWEFETHDEIEVELNEAPLFQSRSQSQLLNESSLTRSEEPI